MTASSRSAGNILASLLLGLILGLVAVPRGAQSFVVPQVSSSRTTVNNINNNYNYNNLLLSSSSSDDDSEGDAPVPIAVKCVDCDKCDGSGRYGYI